MSARHRGASVEHYTPAWIADGVQHVFGKRPELDPASCTLANETIQAQRIFTCEKAPSIEVDGLKAKWNASTVFCNPPTPAAAWWNKAMREYCLDVPKSILFLAFSVELFQTAQSYEVSHPLSHTVCIFKKRVKYYEPIEQAIARTEAKLDKSRLHMQRLRVLAMQQDEGMHIVSGGSPPHSSALILATCDAAMRARFFKAFAQHGYIVNPGS